MLLGRDPALLERHETDVSQRRVQSLVLVKETEIDQRGIERLTTIDGQLIETVFQRAEEALDASVHPGTRNRAALMFGRCPARGSVSRHVVKDSAQALAELMSRDFKDTDLVAIYVDGIIVARHHIIAAVGVTADGVKRLLGIVSGSSENAKVVKDLLASLAERGVDLNLPRLW